jgi:hypothetical protein
MSETKKSPPPVFDFNKTTVSKVNFKLRKPHNFSGPIIRSNGSVTYEGNPLRFRTPYMRTPRGLVESEFSGKTEHYFELSLLPSDLFDDCLSKNSQNVDNVRNFVSSLEHSQLLYILENSEDFISSQKEGENQEDLDITTEDMLKCWQNSLIKESNDGYPAKFNFRMTNEVNSEGEYLGVVVKQDFDFTNKKFLLETSDSGKKVIKTTPNHSIKDIGKHFQVRFQLLAEQCYFIYNKESPSESRFGIKWKVEQILYIESPGTQTKENLYTSNNFDDIEIDDIESMNPNMTITVEEEGHLSDAEQAPAKKQKV